jgi:hypothetical protein
MDELPGEGLEPTLCLQKRILNPPRLPFRHPGAGRDNVPRGPGWVKAKVVQGGSAAPCGLLFGRSVSKVGSGAFPGGFG